MRTTLALTRAPGQSVVSGCRKPIQRICPLARRPVVTAGRTSRLLCKALDGKASSPSFLGSSVASPLADLLDEQQEGVQQATGDAAAALDALDAAAPPSPSEQDITPDEAWKQWCKYFELMDECGTERETAERSLKQAIANEEYTEAAKLSKLVAELGARDIVADVLQKIETALAEEDYGAAARLRDQGFTRLQGWWVGLGESDPQGHLLHVTPEYGRWTGKVYTPRDLADIKGFFEEGRVTDRAREAKAAASLQELGTPLLEVFLAQGEEGQLRSQPVSLRPPSTGDDSKGTARDAKVVLLSVQVALDGSTSVKASTAGTDLLPAADTPSTISLQQAVEQQQAQQRAQQPKPQPQQPPKPIARSRFNDDEQDEVYRTLMALKGESLDTDSTSSSSPEADSSNSSSSSALGTSQQAEEADSSVLDAQAQQQAQQQAQPQRTPQDWVAMLQNIESAAQTIRDSFAKSLKDASSAAAKIANDLASKKEGDSSAQLASAPEPPSASASTPAPVKQQEAEQQPAASASASTQQLQEQQQQPADYEVIRQPGSKDSSTAASSSQQKMQQPEQDPLAYYLSEGLEASMRVVPGSSNDTSPSANSNSGTSETAAPRSGVMATVGAASETDEDVMELHRVPADIAMLSADKFTFRARDEPGPGSQQQPEASSSTSSGGSDVQAAWTRSFEVEVPLARRAVGSKGDVSAGTWAKVAEEVAKIQELKSGRSIPRQKLADAIKAAAQQLVEGGAVAQDARIVKVTEAGADASSGLQGKVTYSRLGGYSKTDPFNSLYLGSFGPHGPELLQLSRGKWDDGEECVVGVKLTGDPNVPAGAVSFRAKIGRRHRLDPREVYPDELGIVARYKGEGRVAQAGYRNAHWVDGELLQFSGSSPMTSGAELGFVWSVPGEKRFLILLNKVDLEGL